MPIVVSNQGWVKVTPKPNTRPAKPVDPIDILRGPLAYITGRPEFREPVKKSSIKQMMLEAASMPAPPPPFTPVIMDELPGLAVKPPRSSRARSRVPSEAESSKSSRSKAPSEILEVASLRSSRQKFRTQAFEEADEEIIRPDIHPQDSQSQRSASPTASRHSRAAPSTRSRRHVSSHTAYDDDQDNHRHNRSKRHVSASQSTYSEDREDEYRSRNRGSRTERSYREPSYRDRILERERERERDGYYPHPTVQSPYHPHHYASMPAPVQPIVIYSTPAPAPSCGGYYHSCQASHGHISAGTSSLQVAAQTYKPTSTTTSAHTLVTTTPHVLKALPESRLEPRPAPSEISSVSSGSTRSKAMSYKWYTATQPLIM